MCTLECDHLESRIVNRPEISRVQYLHYASTRRYPSIFFSRLSDFILRNEKRMMALRNSVLSYF